MPIQALFFTPHPPILIHEIGQGREREAADTLQGFESLNTLAEQLKPEAVLIITPHGPMFEDAIAVLAYERLSGGLKPFGVAHGPSWPLARDLLKSVETAAASVTNCMHLDEDTARRYRIAPSLDHGAVVPLRLLPALEGLPILCITPGFLEEETLYTAGARIGGALNALHKRILVIASGDLSHCHEGGNHPYAPEGPAFDERISRALAAGDVQDILNIPHDFAEKAAQCALKPFVLGLGMIDTIQADFSVYGCSAPFGVGYLTASAVLRNQSAPSLLKKQSEDSYVRLAQAAIEYAVRYGQELPWHDYAKEANAAFVEELENRRAGAFVSIHKHGELRGCIGTTQATRKHLGEEIAYCAQEAALYDPRFERIEESEIPALAVKVDVLHEPQDTTPEGLDPQKYGVIVQKGSRRGLLLPALHGVDTARQQIEIACQKAGIPIGSPVHIQRFLVERHE
ncbi:MAG: AmmeMemoRadiSam system protein A [Christensenellales bacterium]|jgi:AmmeMemoRadiSam system protein A